jgi:hypothetical protein
MIAANNLVALFDYIFPIVKEKCGEEKITEIVNKCNSTGNTPLRKFKFIQIMLLSLKVRKW